MKQAMIGVLVVTALALAALLFGAAEAGPPTRLPDSMVAAPPTTFTAIRVLTPTGWVLAQPDASIVIDLAAQPPVIRAVLPQERCDMFDVIAAQQSLSLSVAPGFGEEPVVYRNGLLMAPGRDYSIQGQVVLFLPGQPLAAGDIVQAFYRVP
jgi:hypothetical protein